MSTNDGGNAFPVSNDANKEYNYIHLGMSLLDYFAAEAMPLALDEMRRQKDVHDIVSFDYGDVAHEAYKIAAAMIKERRSMK